MPFAAVGDVINRQVSFSLADVARFAADVGDPNPLHNDPAYADATRFGGIIVSGPQVLGHFFSALPNHFCRQAGMVGLGCDFKLLGATYPDRLLDMRWEVVAVETNEKLGGDIVTLDGSVTDSEGRVSITATFKALVVAKL